MGSADQVDIVLLQEVTHNIAPENKTHSSLVLGPAWHTLLRISPKKIAEETLVWDLQGAD